MQHVQAARQLEIQRNQSQWRPEKALFRSTQNPNDIEAFREVLIKRQVAIRQKRAQKDTQSGFVDTSFHPEFQSRSSVSAASEEKSQTLCELENARKATHGYGDPAAWQREMETKAKPWVNSQNMKALEDARAKAEARQEETNLDMNSDRRPWEETEEPRRKAHRNSLRLQHPQPTTVPEQDRKNFGAGRINFGALNASAENWD